MSWWQSGSSSSSSKSSPEDGLRNMFRLFSGRRHSHSSQPRQFSRGRKLRYFAEDDVRRPPPPVDPPELWRSATALEISPNRSSSGAAPAAAPLPLPLPELGALLRRDSSLVSNSNSADCLLMSLKEAGGREGVEDRGKSERLNGDGVMIGSKFSGHDARKSTDHSEPQSSKKSNGKKSNKNNCQINIPVSAPTSPYSSPLPSPHGNNGDLYLPPYMIPPIFQVWSAPELPSSDMNQGLGFPHQTFPEKTAFSVDSSPLRSPRVSPHQTARSPSGPISPLHSKSTVEIASSRWEGNPQADVHPLPRPPGGMIPSQTTVPQFTIKPEVMPLRRQWKKGKLIGRGTFGSVYVASNRETGALCAMKEVELLPEDTKYSENIKQLEQEIKVLSQLKHPNIVQYYGSEIVGDRFYIYLEYVHPGSINKFIHDHCGAITESVVRNFTRHILSGLAYLHSTKTIHRDIKGANLLVDAYGVVKLADFGMAKHLTGQAADLSMKGSPYWMAPELLQSVMQKDARADHALAVDIWSLGCTIIEMLNGKPPWSEYEGAAAMFKVMRETPPIPETLSAEGKDFLHCCFLRDPSERPTAAALLEHRFLRNSQQLDVPICSQFVHGMKLTDKAQAPGEVASHKVNQLPEGKLVKKTLRELKVAPHRSPRSILEAISSLSPPRLGRTSDPVLTAGPKNNP